MEQEKTDATICPDAQTDKQSGQDSGILGHLSQQLHHYRIPFGSTNDDLYDEGLARAYRRGAWIAAIYAGAACSLAVASVMFACMPDEAALTMALAPTENPNALVVPRIYSVLRNIVPITLSAIPCGLCNASSEKIAKLHINYLFEDEPTSATLFCDVDEDADHTSSMRLCIASLLFLCLGLLASYLAHPRGPLCGSGWEWLAHIACCSCVSMGAGLATLRAVLSSLCSRAGHIDEYDHLVSECGADDDFVRKLYLDHVRGIADLVGSVITLFAMSLLLARIFKDLGSFEQTVELLVKSMALPVDHVRIIWLVWVLRMFAPWALASLAVVMIMKALLRNRRFVMEWPYLKTPDYSHALEGARDALFPKAVLLGLFSITVGSCATHLVSALGNGSLVGVRVSWFEANVALILAKALQSVAAGRAVARAAECLLVGKTSYDASRMSRSIPYDYDELWSILERLWGVRNATSDLLFVMTIASFLLVMVMVL